VNEPDSGSVAGPGSGSTPGGVTEQALSQRPARSKALRWTVELVVIIAAAFVLALLLQHFVVKPFAIPSPSMEPTLLEGDRVLVYRLAYRFHPPERGDIIVFHPPGRSGSDPYIKRIVAVAGDVVAVHDGVLWLNGQPQDEPYLKEHPILGEYPETRIEPGYVWAMGDNRNNSGDSRVFGPVSVDLIMGKAFAIYWPLRRAGGL
jgi:signal peptidase I